MADDTKIRADWSRLTEKQQLLVKKFLKSGNKLGSYIEVYYPDGTDGKNRKTIISNCYKEFKKPWIAVIIDQVQQTAVKRAEIKIEDIVNDAVDDLVEEQKDISLMRIDAAWVLKRAALLADFNIKKFIKVDHLGTAVYDFTDATDDDWYCIHEYVTESSFIKGDLGLMPVDKVKLKTYDKLRALELVGKHIDIGAFKDKLELSGDKDKPLAFIVRGDDANL